MQLPDHATSNRIVYLFEEVEPQVRTMLASIGQRGARGLEKELSSASVKAANTLLRDVRRILAREHSLAYVSLLPTTGLPLTGLDLAIRLEAARSALHNFRERYRMWDDVADDYLWLTS